MFGVSFFVVPCFFVSFSKAKMKPGFRYWHVFLIRWASWKMLQTRLIMLNWSFSWKFISPIRYFLPPVVFLQNICSLMPLIPDIAAAESSTLCNCFCLQKIIPFSTLLFAGPSRHRDQLFPWRKPRRMSCYFSSCTIQRKKSCGKGFSLLSHLCFTQWCI